MLKFIFELGKFRHHLHKATVVVATLPSSRRTSHKDDKDVIWHTVSNVRVSKWRSDRVHYSMLSFQPAPCPGRSTTTFGIMTSTPSTTTAARIYPTTTSRILPLRRRPVSRARSRVCWVRRAASPPTSAKTAPTTSRVFSRTAKLKDNWSLRRV